jgi:hypothetical protein
MVFKNSVRTARHITQNAQLLIIKAGGTYTYHWALKHRKWNNGVSWWNYVGMQGDRSDKMKSTMKSLRKKLRKSFVCVCVCACVRACARVWLIHRPGSPIKCLKGFIVSEIFVALFWDLAPCCFLETDRRFGYVYCLSSGRWIDSSSYGCRNLWRIEVASFYVFL